MEERHVVLVGVLAVMLSVKKLKRLTSIVYFIEIQRLLGC